MSLSKFTNKIRDNNLYETSTLEDFDDLFNSNFKISYNERINSLRTKQLYQYIFNYCLLKFKIKKLYLLIKTLGCVSSQYLNINFFNCILSIKKTFAITFLLKILNEKIKFNKNYQKFKEYKKKLFINIVLNSKLKTKQLCYQNILSI